MMWVLADDEWGWRASMRSCMRADAGIQSALIKTMYELVLLLLTCWTC